MANRLIYGEVSSQNCQLWVIRGAEVVIEGEGTYQISADKIRQLARSIGNDFLIQQMTKCEKNMNIYNKKTLLLAVLLGFVAAVVGVLILTLGGPGWLIVPLILTKIILPVTTFYSVKQGLALYRYLASEKAIFQVLLSNQELKKPEHWQWQAEPIQRAERVS